MTEEPDLDLPEHVFTAGPDDAGKRLDLFLTAHFPEHSRTWLAKQVDEGNVRVVPEGGGPTRKMRPGLRIELGDEVTVRLPPREAAYAVPEKIPLTILHEDAGFIVLNKPPGLTVHPGSSAHTGTLANALAWHFGELSHVQGPMRPGIVHRLDKDTSGVMVVAKDDTSHWALADQFRTRTVRKEYHAIVRGVVELDADLISGPIGPDRRQPTKMSVRMDIGRESETYFEVVERFKGFTWVRCMPKSGRTHQIRVHMASIGHPLVSDRLYGGYVPALWDVCPRQALHARSLTFRHPQSGDMLTFEAKIPDDITRLIEFLRQV